MNRKPVSWNQHWLPRAIRTGVRFVEGDHYYASRTSVMGAGAFYSTNFDGWIHHYPFEEGKKAYSLADHDFKLSSSDKMPDGVTTVVAKKKHHYSQDELKAEFDRLQRMGASDKSRRVDGKDIVYMVAEQEREDAAAAAAAPVEDSEKYDALKVEYDKLKATYDQLAADSGVLPDKVWEWFENHIQQWNFTDAEKAELTNEMRKVGIHAPQTTYLVQVSVPKNMTPDMIRDLLHGNQIEITEISA